MKYFVVSDIHGHATLLKQALSGAGYDPGDSGQMLICCGDCFDRGTENNEVLKYLDRIDRKIMIKGNHEERLAQLLLDGKLSPKDWMNGTLNTLREFFGIYSVVDIHTPVDFSGKTATLDRLCDFIDEMIDYYETENYVFVHGWLPNERGNIISEWRNSDANGWHSSRWTYWRDGRHMPGYKEKKTVVCGHYPTPDGSIYYGDGFIAIDACTVMNGRVNVLVIEDEELK